MNSQHIAAVSEAGDARTDDASTEPASEPSRTITLSVNGRRQTCQVSERKHLADFLRQDLALTGTHVGCEHGVCGACTVWVDGVTARSCLMLAVQTDGSDVRTVESLALDGGGLSVLQQAFQDHHGLQCGFCTPGILMSLTELLRDDPEPDEATVRLTLSGHLCRCTGYQNIVAAALDAAAKLRAAR
ncbi:MAG: (2Fe-2S)-binding protein [Proteobacteria bacterium]|nr:(2Fe-2S)-binding protein [Burkholderiales bacterium]